MDARGQLGPFAGASSQRYVVDTKLASGGMATVYLGRALGAHGFERTVAIKACHPHLLEDDARVSALVDEARAAARIRHPNVVAMLDVVPHEGSLLLVMEYVEGVTLADLLRDGPLALPIALRVLLDVLAGLSAVHAHGIVHRDVSPQNVLVGVDGFAKLADFGVAKTEGRLAASTATGIVKGKLGYVAPEAYREEALTTRADLHAVGILLWECIAGKRLFSGPSHASVMQRVLRGAIPSLVTASAEVPLELDALVARATASDPQARYATAEALACALEGLGVVPASARDVAALVRARKPLRSDVPPAVEITPAEAPARVVVSPRHLVTATVVALGAVAGILVARARVSAPASAAFAAEPAATTTAMESAAPPAFTSAPSPSPVKAAASAVAPPPARAPARPKSSAAPARSGFYDPKEL